MIWRLLPWLPMIMMNAVFVVVGLFGIISEYNYDLLHISYGITVPWPCLPYKSLGLHLAPHMMH